MIVLVEVVVIFAVTDDNKGKYIIDYQKVEKGVYRYFIPYKFMIKL